MGGEVHIDIYDDRVEFITRCDAFDGIADGGHIPICPDYSMLSLKD